jgi:hypothetical protein
MRTHTVGALIAQAGTFALATLAACSSSSPAPADTGGDAAACNPCGDDEGGTTTTAGHDSNPEGVPYPAPAGGYGHNPRSGSTPGDVLANFKFLGYLNGDSTQPLTTISMADYYDPCNKRYKMIHLSVAAVWCVPCNEETTAVVAAKSTLDGEQVVVLQALDDGPTEGTGATLSDLKYWITNHNSNFTEMLDPGLKNLGGFFNAAAIPWNADFDPRTMEMLDSSEGWSGDINTEISTSVLPATPSYPIPASANCGG